MNAFHWSHFTEQRLPISFLNQDASPVFVRAPIAVHYRGATNGEKSNEGAQDVGHDC